MQDEAAGVCAPAVRPRQVRRPLGRLRVRLRRYAVHRTTVQQWCVSQPLLTRSLHYNSTGISNIYVVFVRLTGAIQCEHTAHQILLIILLTYCARYKTNRLLTHLLTYLLMLTMKRESVPGDCVVFEDNLIEALAHYVSHIGTRNFLLGGGVGGRNKTGSPLYPLTFDNS